MPYIRETIQETAVSVIEKDFKAYKKAVQAEGIKVSVNSIHGLSGYDSVSSAMEILFCLSKKNKYEKEEIAEEAITNDIITYTTIERPQLKAAELIPYYDFREEKHYLLIPNKGKGDDAGLKRLEVKFPMLVKYKNMRKNNCIRIETLKDLREYLFNIQGLISATTDFWNHITYDMQQSSEINYHKKLIKAGEKLYYDFEESIEEVSSDRIEVQNDYPANQSKIRENNERDFPIVFYKWNNAAFPKYVNRAVQFSIRVRASEWENNPNNKKNEENYVFKISELWEELYLLNPDTGIEKYFNVEKGNQAVSRNLLKWKLLLKDFHNFCFKYAKGEKNVEHVCEETVNIYGDQEENDNQLLTDKKIIRNIKASNQKVIFLVLFVNMCRERCRRIDTYKTFVLKIIFLHHQLYCDNPLTASNFYSNNRNKLITDLLLPVIEQLNYLGEILRKLPQNRRTEMLVNFSNIELNTKFLSKVEGEEYHSDKLQDWRNTEKQYSRGLSTPATRGFCEEVDGIISSFREQFYYLER